MSFHKGDRVRMTDAMRHRIMRRVGSLRDVSAGEIAQADSAVVSRGTVVKVYTDRGRVKVRWDHGEINLVLPSNLEAVSVVDRLAELDDLTGRPPPRGPTSR